MKSTLRAFIITLWFQDEFKPGHDSPENPLDQKILGRFRNPGEPRAKQETGNSSEFSIVSPEKNGRAWKKSKLPGDMNPGYLGVWSKFETPKSGKWWKMDEGGKADARASPWDVI